MNKRLKILHLPKWYPNPDDPQLGIFIKNQILALQNDCDNVVLSIIGSSRIRALESNISNKPNLIQIQVCYPSYGSSFKKLKSYLRAIELSLSIVTDLNFYPDIVHAHITGRNLYVANKYFKDTPLIISEHWSGYLDGRFEKMPVWKKKYYRKYLNKANQIIAVSNHLAEAIKSKNVKSPFTIIDNIIEVNNTRGLKEENFTFLLVNDLVNKTKNITGVISAFSNILLTHPNAQLHIIGDGEDKTRLTKLVDELKINNQVKFIGRLIQEEVLAYYSKVHVVVVNSNFETYSMVTAESILSGIPVIATKCGGPEQFINDQNGILIDTEDVDQLINAMKKMVINKKDYDWKKVSNSIQKNLSADLVAKKIISVYQTLI